ncbi:MAG: hypothetical protein ABW208_03155 [Pyrinomonadaceae bacterium]
MRLRSMRATALARSLLVLLAAVPASAQEQVIKRLRFARGSNSKTVKGQVSPEGNRYLYFFKARKGQRLTVHLVSDDGNAVCDVMSHGQFDVNPVVEETVDWTGRLPEADAGEYSVEVRSTGGLAKYVLEITIK